MARYGANYSNLGGTGTSQKGKAKAEPTKGKTRAARRRAAKSEAAPKREPMKVPAGLKKPKEAVLSSYKPKAETKPKYTHGKPGGGMEGPTKPKYTHGKPGGGTEGPGIGKGKLRKRRVMSALKDAWRKRSGDDGRKAFGID